MASVRLQNIIRKFGKTTAVDNLSLNIKHGELVCLLGPSGCGKTTTLRMIAGLEVPTSGEIYIGNRLVNDIPPKERNVSMVFQFYAMYPDLEVFDQLAFPLMIKKVPREEVRRRVKDVAELLGLSEMLRVNVTKLSMEQKQKVELGRALVKDAAVYLLDEPLTNLDAKVRAHMRGELRHLQIELKTTFIYVTHDQLEAMAIADRIAVMNLGRLLQYDDPETLYKYPKNLFTAGFVGSPSMNFIQGNYKEKNREVFLDTGNFLYNITYVKEARKEPLGSELVMGVRPENVRISKKRKSEEDIPAVVEFVEPLAHRMIVHLKIGDLRVKSNIRVLEIALGEKVWVRFERENVRIFDRKTESIIV